MDKSFELSQLDACHDVKSEEGLVWLWLIHGENTPLRVDTVVHFITGPGE